MARRHAVRAANPGVRNGQLSKMITTEWKSLSQEEQDPWFEQADQLAITHIQQNPWSPYVPDYRRIHRRRGERAARAQARALREASAQGVEQGPAEAPNQEHVEAQEEAQQQPEAEGQVPEEDEDWEEDVDMAEESEFYEPNDDFEYALDSTLACRAA
ncbi:hypothetical protein GGR55DRAFT_676447 [Xylaria sp. FL0064]|nr:hypothetical protein GGR55DRAFT_676447 [Xylaria sp. FL0064]